MTNDKCNPSEPSMLTLSDITAQATALCNELDELMALHHFYYQATEHYFNDRKPSFKRGLSLFPSMLRERDVSILDRIHQLQEQLREIKHTDLPATS